ncbi:MAG: hypothetical protein M3Y87_33650 [Myxococcota bacterium]|nr:hypothetical protein [Myxococcota bacterium]
MIRANDLVRQIATLAGIAFGIAVNITFAARIADGASPAGEQPLDAAAYAFGIWGLIFVGEGAYAIYQALPSQRERTLHRSVGRWAAINGVAQGLWVSAVILERFFVAWLLIVVMLCSLIAIELATGARRHGLRPRDRWLVRAPFAINLGWVSVALALSTASLLEGVVGWSGAPLGAVGWSVIVVLALAALALLMLALRGNAFFGGAAVWALIAIAIGSDAQPIVITAVVAAIVVGIGVGAALARRHDPDETVSIG